MPYSKYQIAKIKSLIEVNKDFFLANDEDELDAKIEVEQTLGNNTNCIIEHRKLKKPGFIRVIRNYIFND